MEIYVVKAGDSVDSIAASQGIPVDQLIWDNQIEYPYRLAVGQALFIGKGELPFWQRISPEKFPAALPFPPKT